VSRPSFDFSLLAGALLHRRFIPRARARALFRGRFREPRQIFQAIDKKETRRFAAFSPPGPVDVIELDIDG